MLIHLWMKAVNTQVWIYLQILQKLFGYSLAEWMGWSVFPYVKTVPIIKFNNHIKQFLLQFLVVVRFLYSDRAHTVLKSPWILGVVLKKSVDSIFPSKALKFLCKSLKSPWIFFNFECSELERIFWCFLLVQDRI